MASGAVVGDGFFRAGGFEGCIAYGDVEITRRPYHRNCSCALHKMHGKCSHVSLVTNVVSFPSRRAWSEGSLALVVSASRRGSSPYSSPAVGPTTDVSRGGRSLVEFDTHKV
ncbi:Zinc finger, SWIM-type [Cynara cardunculus var. scolymus]|uniref:Zinc finger, SWIM-type n=1 Tax=Cynara cardunculus var. scolymus TaxID=59895 RepID=A0A118JSI3_CYNCS|nr:Zinc finger, SWIM-type [Cynara cardunculus var. scolymus]